MDGHAVLEENAPRYSWLVCSISELCRAGANASTNLPPKAVSSLYRQEAQHRKR